MTVAFRIQYQSDNLTGMESGSGQFNALLKGGRLHYEFPSVLLFNGCGVLI